MALPGPLKGGLKRLSLYEEVISFIKSNCKVRHRIQYDAIPRNTGV